MTAALRCGATLHPTPREVARDALVAAAAAEELARQEQGRMSGGTHEQYAAAVLAHQKAESKYRKAAIAYLAATEPTP